MSGKLIRYGLAVAVVGSHLVASPNIPADWPFGGMQIA